MYRYMRKPKPGTLEELVDANITGIVIWNFEGGILEANDEFLRIVEYGREELVSGRLRWTDHTPPEWRNRDERALEEAKPTAG
jgi:PAS domain-containing protein